MAAGRLSRRRHVSRSLFSYNRLHRNTQFLRHLRLSHVSNLVEAAAARRLQCADFAYRRRIKRILPLYLLSILLVLVAAASWFLFPLNYKMLRQDALKPLVFAANMTVKHIRSYLDTASLASIVG